MTKREIISFLTDIIYPNRCPCCEEFISWNELVCRECLKEMPLPADMCRKCGMFPCMCNKGFVYDSVSAVYAYHGAAVNGVISMKRGIGRNFAYHLGTELAEILKSEYENQQFDMVTAVPMAFLKRLDRGYNQSDLIARRIAEILEVEYHCILAAHSSSQEQHKLLSASQRAEHVKGLYYIKNNINLKGKNIILCDDVITTGSTCNECSKLLKTLGAEKIFVASGTSSIKFMEVSNEIKNKSD